MRERNHFVEIEFGNGMWKRYTIFASGEVAVATPILGTGRHAQRWIGNIDKFREGRK